MKGFYWVIARNGACSRVLGTYARKGYALRMAEQFAQCLAVEVRFLQPYGELVWSNR